MQEEILLRAPRISKRIPQFPIHELSLYPALFEDEDDDELVGSYLELIDFEMHPFELGFDGSSASSLQYTGLSNVILNALNNKPGFLRRERQSTR